MVFFNLILLTEYENCWMFIWYQMNLRNFKEILLCIDIFQFSPSLMLNFKSEFVRFWRNVCLHECFNNPLNNESGFSYIVHLWKKIYNWDFRKTKNNIRPKFLLKNISSSKVISMVKYAHPTNLISCKVYFIKTRELVNIFKLIFLIQKLVDKLTKLNKIK